ncbi:MAG: LysR family transcriptional regulator [Deltaproteobacteria bacterium]|jgi:DNA-binding transcriptional LysR family regulator|nr:LysR family transcriptional regulator [Deltaproteobacteria bacterium]
MEIQQLRSFRAVASLLSFNKAADRLHYAQSSISAQIRSLEEELDVQLFDRLGKRIQLTESGMLLLEYANKILDMVDESKSLIRTKEPVGSLTIRIPETLGVHRLPPVLKAFHAKFPKVQLNLISCTLEGLNKDLHKGVTDLAFLLAESMSSSDLEMETVGFESLVLVANPEHPLSAKRTVHTRDLSGATILLSRLSCGYKSIFEQMLKDEEVYDYVKFECSSVEVIKSNVMNGLGISILPEVAVAEEVGSKRLVILPWSEGGIDVAILMIWLRDRWMSPTLQAFMEVARALLKR